MDPSSRLKKQPPLKQNSSLRSNRVKIKIRHNIKNNPKVQTSASDSATPQSIQKCQLKKQVTSKEGSQFFQTRKHIYNMKQIVEIRDIRTGKSQFKFKQTIKYVMDDYNEILKLGTIILNVSPLSSNIYNKTEWQFLSDQGQDKQYIKTQCTSKMQKCDEKQEDQKFECVCKICKASMTAISKSQELHKGFQNFDFKCQSKSFELFQKYNNETSQGNNLCRTQAISQSQSSRLKK